MQNHDTRGILMVTQNRPALVEPEADCFDGVCRYGVGFPFQVAPRLAGMFCNIRAEEQGMADSEIGVDIALFDDHRHIDSARSIPVAYVEEVKDAETGKVNISLKYPAGVGFVPSHALLPDGTPHPQAGTGFCMVVTQAYPKERFDPTSTEAGKSPIYGAVDRWCEAYQLVFNGRAIEVTGQTRVDCADVPETCAIGAGGMSCAIQDGTDLLLPVHNASGKDSTDKKGVPGIARWRFINEAWRPVEFLPVGPENWCEPSLVRDTDNSLLFTSRSYRTGLVPRADIWRSLDTGLTWEPIIRAQCGMNESPLSINMSSDGVPYFAANARVTHNPWNYSRKLREKGGGQKFGRCKLAIWELTEDRKGLLHPRTVRDFFDSPDFFIGEEFSYWRADHPIGNVVRLADGKWHSLLAYRVIFREKHESSGAPMPQTGLHLEEIVCGAGTVPAWRFPEDTSRAEQD